MPEGSSRKSSRSSRHQAASAPSSSPRTPVARVACSSTSTTAANSTPSSSRTCRTSGRAAVSGSRARASALEIAATAPSSRSRSETRSSASRARRIPPGTSARSRQRAMKSSAGTKATVIAASENQVWPPNGRRSWRTSRPKTVAAIAIAGNIVTTATSSGCARARSRQTAGTSAAATTTYAPARRSSGSALKRTASVPVLTARPNGTPAASRVPARCFSR